MDDYSRPRRRAVDLRSKLDAINDPSTVADKSLDANTALANNIGTDLEIEISESANGDLVAEGDRTESMRLDDLPSPRPSLAKSQLTKTGWRQWLDFRWPPRRKEWLTAGGVAILLICVVSASLLFHHSKPVATVKTVQAKPKLVTKPAIVPSTLNGLPVAPSVNQLPVTGVMIENSTDARPQSGLGQAGVVFEAVAEGGVTRFLALYQDTSPSNVGPIRSARPYYIQWDLGFDAPYAHVGGSPDALTDIQLWGVKDLDEFYNGSSYHRITTREAPHNLYTAISTLNQLETSKGYLHSTFTGFPRKADMPAKQPTAATISLTLSGPLYNPQYTYVASSNSYNRSEGGSPQLDANTNQQISPKVVIAIVVPESQGALDATGAYYSDYNVIGSGTAYIFQDGIVATGQWSKTTSSSQISFSDSNGQTIKLNAGQTWITAVTSASDVSYSQ